MKCAGVQPSDSSSPMDRRHQPCLLFYNNSLPSLHSPRLTSTSQVILSHSFICAQCFITVFSIFTRCLFLFKVPNAAAVALRAAHPPFSSQQQLSLSTEVKHDCGTFSTLSPCSHHCCKVGQSSAAQFASSIDWLPLSKREKQRRKITQFYYNNAFQTLRLYHMINTKTLFIY